MYVVRMYVLVEEPGPTVVQPKSSGYRTPKNETAFETAFLAVVER